MKQNFLILMTLFLALPSFALEIEGADTGVDPQNFPTKAFSSRQCSPQLPVRKGKNPWLKIVKKKVRSVGLGGSSHPLDSYYVVPTAKDKRFAVINAQDSIYDTATSLEKIDCKHGLLYFRKAIGEVTATNYYRVYDLYTGAEYRNTEGVVTMSPNGQFLLNMTAVDRDQKCGTSTSCDVSMKLYECPGREKNLTECKLAHETTYSVNARNGKNAYFSVLPVKWNWIKFKKQMTLKIGGTKKSPAQIICDILPSYKCRVKPSKNLEITEATAAP